MGALSTAYPTLYDVARSLDPNGQVAKVAEILQQYNEILDDIPVIEGNLPTGHQVTVRTGIPEPTLRMLNGGVVPSKSVTGQIVETCAIIEDLSHIDVDVAALNGNTAAYRLMQDKGKIQGMMNTAAYLMIYGDTGSDPKEFDGLHSRYFGLTTSTCPVAYNNVIDAGGTGSDNTSIWLVVWGPETVYSVYPKGSKAGLFYEDRGKQSVLVDTSTGAYMRVWESWYQWKMGLAVADWRAVVRIANIDVSNLLTAGDSSDTSANIIKLMSRALDKIPPNVTGRKVFYMNETVRSMLRVKMLDKSNVLLRLDEVKGLSIPRPDGVLTFMGVPCRRVDAITNAESALS